MNETHDILVELPACNVLLARTGLQVSSRASHLYTKTRPIGVTRAKGAMVTMLHQQDTRGTLDQQAMSPVVIQALMNETGINATLPERIHPKSMVMEDMSPQRQ